MTDPRDRPGHPSYEDRASARAEHARLVAEGRCANRPDGLLGPTCDFEKGHEGRCSWGPFFEQDGSFHAVDPDGEYPRRGLNQGIP